MQMAAPLNIKMINTIVYQGVNYISGVEKVIE